MSYNITLHVDGTEYTHNEIEEFHDQGNFLRLEGTDGLFHYYNKDKIVMFTAEEV